MTATDTTTTTTTTAEPLTGLAASWVLVLQAERKARGTIRLYEGSVRAFAAWHAGQAPGMPVVAASLDRKTAAAFLSDLLEAGAAPATVRSRYAALRLFAAWLADEGETDADLLLGMRPPKLDQAPVDSLTPAELGALIRACRAPAGAGRWEQFEALRDEAVVRLLADTGARAGECVALTVDAVDLRARRVRVTRAKGGKWRVSAFSAETARAIDRYLRKGRRGHRLAHTPALWLGTANRHWSYSALRGSLSRRAETAGVKGFHPHRLRHTAAESALDAGVAEGSVMASFGWASRQMLDRYTLTRRQERAAEEFTRYFDQQGR
jgi:integrase/recombinase XerD